jgi:hypothetical protein
MPWSHDATAPMRWGRLLYIDLVLRTIGPSDMSGPGRRIITDYGVQVF